MQWLSFGRILKLPVRNGEPVLDQTVRVIRTVKTGADNRPRAESHWRDFVLKREVMDLFAELGRIGNGVVRLIEVKHGLPFLIEIEEAVHT